MSRQVSRSRMARKDIGNLSIPEDIADSLCSCGGPEGLADCLPTNGLLEKMRERYQACADPVRLKILALLMVQPLCVCVIKAVVKIADSKLSYHLTILKNAGMIHGEQQGQYIIYRIAPPAQLFMETELKRYESG